MNNNSTPDERRTRASMARSQMWLLEATTMDIAGKEIK